MGVLKCGQVLLILSSWAVRCTSASPYVFQRDLPNTWSIDAGCSTSVLPSGLVSSLENLPKTWTIDASGFCSVFLQPFSTITSVTTTTGVSTVSSVTYTTTTSTTINTGVPTSTKYCAEPTPSMICGLANGNIVDPTVLDEDWTDPGPLSSAEDCYQKCLANPACKSYFTSQYPDGSASWNCDIFRNTLAGNVGYNATLVGAAGNFFDRGCVENLPKKCTASPPAITASPKLKERQDTSFIVYNYDAVTELLPSDFWGWREVGSYGFPAACSCIITSASPRGTTISRVTERVYTKTITTTSTNVYTWDVYLEPHLTTVYRTIP